MRNGRGGDSNQIHGFPDPFGKRFCSLLLLVRIRGPVLPKPWVARNTEGDQMIRSLSRGTPPHTQPFTVREVKLDLHTSRASHPRGRHKKCFSSELVIRWKQHSFSITNATLKLFSSKNFFTWYSYRRNWSLMVPSSVFMMSTSTMCTLYHVHSMWWSLPSSLHRTLGELRQCLLHESTRSSDNCSAAGYPNSSQFESSSCRYSLDPK